ncbi:MAG TPA: alpha/beta fold hydrolase [Polyangiaceae bacterium]|nr:alpha/beta fold hydrolase [Polyangiaceae bacterium]
MRLGLPRPRPRAAMLGGAPLGTLLVSGGSPSLLALHGFGATTQEVAMVVDIARQLGLAARAPLLPGHGSSVHELARTRYADWLGAAARALRELSNAAAPVIVVGSSMGSLLALDLAADFPDLVAGVGVLGCPIRLGWPWPSLALAAVELLGIPDFTLRKSGPDIRDPVARRTQVTYGEQPAHAGNEVRRAGHRVERRLGSVVCPAFVAHGREDHVCPVRNARLVHEKLGTPVSQKELLILERSYHIITRDLERDLLATRLTGFIERVARAAREPKAAPAPNAPSDAGGTVPARRAVGLG